MTLIITKNSIYYDYNDNFDFFKTSPKDSFHENKMLSQQSTTPLHIACSKNDYPLIKSQINLFKQFFDFKDIDENYPIFCLFKNENISQKFCLQILKILFFHNYNINQTNKFNQNIIHQCCLYETPEIVEFLCKQNANVNHRDIYNKTPLHYACEYGFFNNAIVLIVNNALVHINECNIQPIHLLSLSKESSVEKLIEFTKLLLDNGADVNSIHSIFGYTPLHSACIKNNILLIYFLHENGANPNIKQISGNTPLHLCSNLDIIKLLIKYNADPNIENNLNRKPIDIAITKKNQDIIDFYKQL